MSRKPFKIPEILTDNEVKEFLNVFNKRYISSHKNYLMVRISLETGMRVSEVLNLHIEDIDLNTGKVHIKQGKNDKDRIVHISNQLLEEVIVYRDRIELGMKGLLFTTRTGQVIDKKNIDRMLKTYSSKTSIDKNIHFHMFRHTYGTKIYRETKDIRLVQQVLGHSDISTTMIYTHISNEEIEKVMTKNNPYDI